MTPVAQLATQSNAPEPTGSVRHGGSTAPASDRRNGSDLEQAGNSGIPNGRTRGRKSGDVDRSELVFALGCAETSDGAS
jgi:hypothetical protein